MNRTLTFAALAVASAWARQAVAQDGPKQTTGCSGPLDADAVVRCALAASPEVRAARAELDAAGGRRATAGVWLPSNPTVAALVSNRRRSPPESASVLNWSVVLSQELEIAGQRGARVDAVDAEVAARARRVGVAEQDVAAGALMAYYEASAAQETLRFAAELAQTAQTLAAFAEGRAREAMLAGVEADVARAEATRIGLVRFEAERRLADARAALAVLLDIDMDAGSLVLPAVLTVPSSPLPAGRSLEDQALRLRGEVAAAEMERQVLERRLALVRRERVPNLTFSAFAERGEINDRILGVGLSVPLPLPAPVGRTRAGEIAETMAQIRAAESSEELVRRRVRLEVARAQAALKARQGAADLFAGDLLKRARTDLSSLREAISSHQLSLREALQWQRTFIELLQADIEVRLGSALAWVELRRVAGLPLAVSQAGAR
ncbi:MAG: outer membrane protein heavy metal efflux system [Chloroflexota bacterium]|jgi:cobalt-zinc-cadmium efflux system outer membrane protein|nr:outer membrane protein heavy metal efflux system [Chloroflexota bacterium]